jgi:hypothetical protein
VYRYEDLCEELGVTNGTLRQYLAHGRRNRAAGIYRPWDMPEPDMVVGVSPVWFSHTVDTWLRARPSKGHGLTAPGHSIKDD